MRIIINNIVKVEDALAHRGFLYLPSARLFVLNYIRKDYCYSPSWILSFKTVLFDEKKGESFYLMDGLMGLLQVSSKGKLYSLDMARHLSIYDIQHRILIKSVPLDLSFGYGSSCIVENINKLYIICNGDEYRPEREGLLVVDLEEDQIVRIVRKVDLGGKPYGLGASHQKGKIFIVVSSTDHIAGQGILKLTILNAADCEILDSSKLDFQPAKMLAKDNHLLMLDWKKGIGIWGIQDKRLIEKRHITGICDMTPVNNGQYYLVLLHKTVPGPHPVCRLALYDLETDTILCEQEVPPSGYLKTFDDGRIFFTEIQGNTLQINEVLVD